MGDKYAVVKIVPGLSGAVAFSPKVFNTFDEAKQYRNSKFKEELDNLKLVNRIFTSLHADYESGNDLSCTYKSSRDGVEFYLTYTILCIEDNEEESLKASQEQKEVILGPMMWKLISTTKADLAYAINKLNVYVPVKEYKVVSPSFVYVIFKEDNVFKTVQDFRSFIKSKLNLKEIHENLYMRRIVGWIQIGQDGHKDIDESYFNEVGTGEWISLNE